jgi:DNA mismatch repair protein MutS
VPKAFESVLFDGPVPPEPAEAAYLADLNLDQLFAVVTAGREEYELGPFFRIPVEDVAAVGRRQAVMRDLEGTGLREAVARFAAGMRAVREELGRRDKLYHALQKAALFLAAVERYCSEASRLAAALEGLDLRSAAMQDFRGYLSAHLAAEPFGRLAAEARECRARLAAIVYSVHIRGRKVTVRRYGGEPDYSAAMERDFARFKQGAARDYRIGIPDSLSMDRVEEGVLDMLAQVYPEAFDGLREFGARHAAFVDETLGRFDREIQFYLAYLELADRMREAGLPFCYPQVSADQKGVHATETYDLALAERLLGEGAPVVTNDLVLHDPERVVVVSGPNQGGKTTFARTFGQLHHLARLGLPVPARAAALYLCDRIFTHFEREEHLEDLRGKLQDELVRLHAILTEATGRSVLIMNESFASTTLRDALFLGRAVLAEVVRRDLLCVYVTFIDELASLGPSIVSVVSEVSPADPARRTFKLTRRPADGRAYALAIARKYGLTYDAVRERVGEERIAR